LIEDDLPYAVALASELSTESGSGWLSETEKPSIAVAAELAATLADGESEPQALRGLLGCSGALRDNPHQRLGLRGQQRGKDDTEDN
jgi:hypothetical protein